MPTLSYQPAATDQRMQSRVLPFTHKARTSVPAFPEIVIQERKRFEISLTCDELPLTVQYDDKTYVLVLTKSNKLLLQKPIN